MEQSNSYAVINSRDAGHHPPQIKNAAATCLYSKKQNPVFPKTGMVQQHEKRVIFYPKNT